MTPTRSRLLLIDNYDSFTYNLVQAFLVLGAEVLVYRNDELTPAAAERMVEIWREAGQQPRPTHAPQHWDDERRCARLLATPALHRAVPHHDAAHSLLKTSKP